MRIKLNLVNFKIHQLNLRSKIFQKQAISEIFARDKMLNIYTNS